MKPCKGCEERRKVLREMLAARSDGDIELARQKLHDFSSSLINSGRELASKQMASVMEKLRPAKRGIK